MLGWPIILVSFKLSKLFLRTKQLFRMRSEMRNLSIHIIVIVVVVVIIVVVVIVIIIVVVVDNIDDLHCNGSEGLDENKEREDRECLLACWLVTITPVSGTGIDDPLHKYNVTSHHFFEYFYFFEFFFFGYL